MVIELREEALIGNSLDLVSSRSGLLVLQTLKQALNKSFWKMVKKREKEGDKQPSPQELMTQFAQLMAQFMTQTQQPSPVVQDEWTVVEAPLKEEIKKEEEETLSNLVLRPDKSVSAKKKLVGFPTGTFLDYMFLSEDDVTPLKGIPICSQIGITGLPGAGKSLLAMEVALNVAHSGRKVLFVTSEDVFTSETPRFDLQSRLIKRAQILNLNWEKVAENLFIMDAATYSELREWAKFIRTYRYACERNKVDLAIIDSITLLETTRGALKYRVSEITRYNQKMGITGIFINQRLREDVDIFGMAGGISLGHTYDAIIIIDYCHAYSIGLLAELKKYGVKRGDFVRFSRVLDCGICGYIRDYILLDIDKYGFLRPVYPMKSD